jgi:hypothetical protein
MNEERRPMPVGRKTRRAHDSVLGLQQIRAGFEPVCALDPTQPLTQTHARHGSNLARLVL